MFEANQNGKQLRLPSLPAESLTMWPELLARALENPLRNALKYAREFIKVDWYREGREWVMTIRDDGPGVPVEQQPRLFLPFFRVDDARNAKTGGTGLGLAIAAEAIQRHGGPSGPAAISRPDWSSPSVCPCPDLPFSSARVLGMLAPVSHQPRILPCSISCSTNRKSPNTGNIIRLCANTGYRLHLIEPLGFGGMTNGSSGPGSTITSLPTSSAGLTMRRFWRPSPPTGLCLHHQGTHRPLGGPVCPR